MLAYELYFAEFPEMTDKQRMTTLIQQIMGHAQEWAVTIWRSGGVLASDYMAFMQEFRDVFNHLDQGQSSPQRLLQSCQGSSSVAEYFIIFCILTADSDWNKLSWYASETD